MASRPEPLEAYRRKRDFTRTSEPPGGRRRAAGNRYVVQKHAARRLHYDFRIELHGVLKSWAVPKGPSMNPTVKRLAVRTEDHPLEYAHFEGVIPPGAYGAGTTMVWDWGTWTALGDPDAGLAQGKLRMHIHGRRLRGRFVLVRLAGGATAESWLLIKEQDMHANADSKLPSQDWNTSVRSGLTLEAIAAGKTARAPAKTRRRAPSGSTSRPMAAFLPPLLPTAVSAPPLGDDWLHEIKHDGYRLGVAAVDGDVRLYTRSGLDWTHRFPSISSLFLGLAAREAWLDGEVVAEDAPGRSRFNRLQAALQGEDIPLQYIAFDLLHLDGEDLRPLPLLERKRRLYDLLRRSPGAIHYGDHIEGDGAQVFAEACRQGLEGLVSKQKNSRYVAGRSRLWLKTKCSLRDEFVIGGMYRSSVPGKPFASLLVGSYEPDGTLRYRGRVGTGYTSQTLHELHARLRPLHRRRSPFAEIPTALRAHTTWVEPRLVAEVAYGEMTDAGIVRHARFVGLREDKEPTAVEAPPVEARLSHPDKVLFAATGATKRDLAAYLAQVAEKMLAHVAGRPLSLVRCPQGSEGSCFFQRHHRNDLPDSFKKFQPDAENPGGMPYVYVEDMAGLLAAAQMNVLELHIWGVRKDLPERPDRLVLDLDPGPGVDFAAVRDGAFEVRGVLDALGLSSFVLLTGGKGVHVVLPLRRRNGWNEVKAFARGLAYMMAEAAPDHWVATATKAARAGKIYLDWRRNERGSTAVAPFSPRAKVHAPVAVPVSWEELPRCRASDIHTLESLPKRLRTLRRDPWAGYFESDQQLTVAMRNAVLAQRRRSGATGR